MELEEDINVLNRLGMISSTVLMRRHKCGIGFAKHILKLIVDNYENVYFKNENKIYIEGRELERLKPKLKIRKKLLKKPARWKDITKP